MSKKRKKVVCIDSDALFLKKQDSSLKEKGLRQFFYPFSEISEAVKFLEGKVADSCTRIHYILLDQDFISERFTSALHPIYSFDSFYAQPEIIVCAKNKNSEFRNRVMQHEFVSAIIEKPIPENYIEFLITGENGVDVHK